PKLPARGYRLSSTTSRLRIYHRAGAGRPIRVVWALELPPTRGEPRRIGQGGRAQRRRGRRARGHVLGDTAVFYRSRSLGSSLMASNTVVFGPSRSSAGDSAPAKARTRMP